MCGRYSLVTTDVAVQIQLGNMQLELPSIARYNIAPTQFAPVVTNTQPGLFQHFTWGLVPFWSKDGKNTGKMINARAEGIESKPSFRQPIRTKRCLVLADSFYEWRKTGTQKQPYRILLQNGTWLVFAGIWEEWRGGEQPMRSFSIITTTPNREMATLHDRMPVLLLDAATQQQWLSENSLPSILALLKPPPDDVLTYYPVNPLMNKATFDAPSIHTPFSVEF
ncbi:MAG: SOS response-associated peptidase [Saprospiraceae bacterium]|nr:SOS response-associated peptidase [Saprospiraceae bacterium]